MKDTIKFVRGITETDGKESSRVNNPDEIDIDMDDDNENEGEEEIEEGNNLIFYLFIISLMYVVFSYDIIKCSFSFFVVEMSIEKQIIPSQVFGSLKTADNDTNEDE